MRVLALETSGRLGSIALLHDLGGVVKRVEERQLPPAERTAKSLLPAVQGLLADHGWQVREIDLVCTTTGPGSFTGLRIGVVAAKTMAYAIGAQLVGVHTLAAMAAAMEPRTSRVWTILDAQRQELFAACFDPGLTVVAQAAPATEVLAVDAWLARLAPGDAVMGPPLAKLGSLIPSEVKLLDEARWTPSAAAAGALAVQVLEAGGAIPPLELVPNYYRKSAAEEKSPL